MDFLNGPLISVLIIYSSYKILMCFSDNSLENDFPEIALRACSRWLSGKESACNTEDIRDETGSLFGEDPLEEEMATHSSILAWKIPWTEESGRL